MEASIEKDQLRGRLSSGGKKIRSDNTKQLKGQKRDTRFPKER